jgi:single-strand DNA-binding protein
MAGETVIHIVGNLTSDPELKFTPSGAAVASFTIASTPRTFDKSANEWKDGEALFLRCSLWREAGENAAESLVKGMRVIATGALKQRSYKTKEGENRTVVELDVEEIGPSLKYATAKVAKANRQGGSQGGGQQSGGGGGQNRGQQNQGSNYGGWDNSRPADAMPAGSRQAPGSGWGASSDEAPF